MPDAGGDFLCALCSPAMPRSYDPRDKDLLAWLSSLSPRDELVARYAVMALLQRCVQSPTWKARAAELRAPLPLGVGEQAAVLRDANRMVEAFRAGAAEIPGGNGGG